ncbi:Endoribonuclease L-PSP/chorismate mutase-like protein [Boeremia exigua]|uniref:Endoribonuclease L-PSP/chorismate mutase-like protein n=1 Tax=Boeremia exigua TaxID=749465 RepID=UPI001E8DBD2C|nr:Endoribonuclease L-PSP/chorismate mutase-like protein [Boeremia exigua]KAH6628979.1 Endoribonuclease L-PSP/chorismate mutase-like protein [Boeremia exigua]
MSLKPSFTTYPGYGEGATERMGYSQALRLGNIVRTSGQSGWFPNGELPKDSATQVERAFENVMQALKSANPKCEWRHVISFKSYHMYKEMDAQFPTMVENIKRRMPHQPVWMCVGTPYIGLPGLLLEIEAEAYVPDEDGEGEGASKL